jgi:hypothetical protein
LADSCSRRTVPTPAIVTGTTMRMVVIRKRARTMVSYNGYKKLNGIIPVINILAKHVLFSLPVPITSLQWQIKAYGV